MKVHKKKLRSLKMDAVSESRQGALVAANSNLTLSMQRKPNLLQRRTSASKRSLSNPSIFAAANLHGPDPLEHETLGI